MAADFEVSLISSRQLGVRQRRGVVGKALQQVWHEHSRELF